MDTIMKYEYTELARLVDNHKAQNLHGIFAAYTKYTQWGDEAMARMAKDVILYWTGSRIDYSKAV